MNTIIFAVSLMAIISPASAAERIDKSTATLTGQKAGIHEARDADDGSISAHCSSSDRRRGPTRD